MTECSSSLAPDPEMGFDDYVLSGQAFSAYHHWIARTIAPSLCGKVIDVGSGPGNVVHHLAEQRPDLEIWATDPYPRAVRTLEERFRGQPRIHVDTLDILQPRWAGIEALGFDAATCLNCLEHLENEELALASMRTLVKPGGTVLVLVPALRSLYCSLDEAAGHHRRYNRDDLRRVLAHAGLRVEALFFFNLLGPLSWLLNGRLRRRRAYSAAQFSAQNRIIPILARLERGWKPPVGLSLIGIARTPEQRES